MTVYFFTLLCRPNGKSDCIKTFNTVESLLKVFSQLFGIRFVLKNYVICHHLYCSKICDFLKRGYLCWTASVQEVGVLLKWNNSKCLGKGLSYVCNLLVLTTKFYFQNQSSKCRVEGYKFRSVYIITSKLWSVNKFIVISLCKSVKHPGAKYPGVERPGRTHPAAKHPGAKCPSPKHPGVKRPG